MSTFNDARVRQANNQPLNRKGQYILYWSQMARRLTHNHALDYAIAMARYLQKPLVVYEGLKRNPPWANARFHRILLEGMRDNAVTARKLGLTYWPFVETPKQPGRGLVATLAKKAALVVTDDYPAYIVPAQIRALTMKSTTAIHAVDNNCVIPLSLLGTAAAAAAHLRFRLHKLFPDAWPHRASAAPDLAGLSRTEVDPPFALTEIPEALDPWIATLGVDASVPAVPEFVGGATAGARVLQAFVKSRLEHYDEGRNQPDDPADTAVSTLSPYLHYGHLSIEQVIADVLNHSGEWKIEDLNRKTRNRDDYFCRDPNVNGFLDEAITWRDIGYHWHYCRDRSVGTQGGTHSWESAGETPAFNFETMDFSPRNRGTLETVLPEWAMASLNKHASDPREYLYSLEEFEAAATHDELWNAAQMELKITGRIHNYLRMLWGKKVLEWSESPEAAYNVLEHLNNKYAIDGRDPNSYTGILWCFGLFDRPWPPERKVFGSIRFMSSANTAKKFDLGGYYRYIRRLRAKIDD